MTTLTCDKCHAAIPAGKRAKLSIKNDTGTPTSQLKKFDLCPTCQGAVVAFIAPALK